MSLEPAHRFPIAQFAIRQNRQITHIHTLLAVMKISIDRSSSERQRNLQYLLYHINSLPIPIPMPTKEKKNKARFGL